jgi:hypothetical protein
LDITFQDIVFQWGKDNKNLTSRGIIAKYVKPSSDRQIVGFYIYGISWITSIDHCLAWRPRHISDNCCDPKYVWNNKLIIDINPADPDIFTKIENYILASYECLKTPAALRHDLEIL